MSEDLPVDESFAAFKNSFSYGSRSDLTFKFLKRLSPRDAAAFFQQQLTALGETIDDGNADRMIQLAYEWQVRAYAAAERQHAYEDRPLTPLAKPVNRSRLALLTSSGHFVAGDDPRPFGVTNMTQEEAMARIDEFLHVAPQLSTIPMTTLAERLRVRHGGYDIRGAARDPNVIFPLDRLRELADDGLIGELAPAAYSFVGATAQTRLTKETAPHWASMLRAEGVDAVLLVPA